MSETKSAAKAAHVNMMTDTIIANMPPEGLRTIMRGMLGGDAKITSNFHNLASAYLASTRPSKIPLLFESGSGLPKPTQGFAEIQGRYRCLMGCGKGFESMELLTQVLQQIHALPWAEGNEDLDDVLAVVDGDIVQSVTAVQKLLLTSSGMKPLESDQAKVVAGLKDVLSAINTDASTRSQPFAFERGQSCLEKLVGGTSKSIPVPSKNGNAVTGFTSSKSTLESVKLGSIEVPRMFMGLWQFSSPAWGTASRTKIDKHFRKHVDAGFIAYDMADHYGDAEVTFGQFRSSQPDADKIYCATKWAVFEPIQVSKETIDANIAERLAAINSDNIELLQFHWQDYNDPQYVEAAKVIQEHPQVQSFGLCNFDTPRMNEIVEAGVQVVSNQVQFSLIDLRPTFKMAESCLRHKVKLLTYGSLCGGFLAEKWLNQPAPNLFDQEMTPSHRKYFEMISIWGGWVLFQELLGILAAVGKKHSVSVSSVAIRWVLDHEYVGAVIIGARMGISEHIEENLKVFSFVLDQDDHRHIDAVLVRCNAKAIFEEMGDCGAEYRQ